KVGGENVAPVEVEAYLMGMPGVDQVAIIGIPDDRLAEVPVAFVVPKNDAPIAITEMDDFCRGKIASFKIPRHVVLVAELPMTPTGKVQKHLLREQAEALNLGQSV
ncbi:MAG: hypothetical protein HOK61_10415, partial [Alphaproteobacteria bacterium]|nr:hypothetical protein [Alphaproteobacteria bacterium]